MKSMLDVVHADGVLDSRETMLVERAFRMWSGPQRQL
jgi:uncharacterized tellurite resistance protein B-like protein